MPINGVKDPAFQSAIRTLESGRIPGPDHDVFTRDFDGVVLRSLGRMEAVAGARVPTPHAAILHPLGYSAKRKWVSHEREGGYIWYSATTSLREARTGQRQMLFDIACDGLRVSGTTPQAAFQQLSAKAAANGVEVPLCSGPFFFGLLAPPIATLVQALPGYAEVLELTTPKNLEVAKRENQEARRHAARPVHTVAPCRRLLPTAPEVALAVRSSPAVAVSWETGLEPAVFCGQAEGGKAHSAASCAAYLESLEFPL